MVASVVLAYTSVITLLVAIAVAIARDWPIFHALAPIKSLRAFRRQLVVVGVVCVLAAWQLFGDLRLLGQQPMTLAMLVVLLYAWACLVANLRRGD